MGQPDARIGPGGTRRTAMAHYADEHRRTHAGRALTAVSIFGLPVVQLKASLACANRLGISEYRGTSDFADKSLLRRACVSHQQQHENHPDKRNRPGKYHQRVEQVRAGRDARVR